MDQAAVWNWTRRLRKLSSLKARGGAGHVREKNTIGRAALHPSIEIKERISTREAQSLHKSCRDRENGQQSLEASARRLRAVSLPRRSWWDNFPYSRRSRKWFYRRPRMLSCDLRARDRRASRQR